jgi:hypothetical protein
MLRNTFIVLAIAIFVLGLTAPGVARAGEKIIIKSHGVNYTTTMHKFEVGDEEGHIVLIYESRAIFANETNGEKFPDRSVGFMNINPNKPAEMYLTGYGVHTDKDGDKMTRSFKGKPVSKDQWKGVYTTTGGTGKYKGATGGGAWTSYMLAPQQSYVEVEGELQMP